MLSSYVYIGLGICDALAMFALMISLYRLPLWSYRFKVAGFVVFIALFSFVMRLVLEVPQLDLPIQYVFFLIFIKFVYRLKFSHSSFVAGAGVTAYAILQLTIYYVYHLVGMIYQSDLLKTEGAVYLIQISSILAAYGIAIFLKYFRLGFSFIRIPQDGQPSPQKEQTSLLIASILSTVTIFLISFFLYNVDSLGITIMAFSTFSISYFLSQRSDYEGVRSIVEASLQQDKAK
ncbi:hypothetical protein EJP77_18215 [Paenibacillus zeisoli]|uniref:Uncharacterized protein n=1 Tax=Paenibacillus zeisoli TaxID=2496267 RepID=A0A3S1JLC7_9BACL|nr:hypothetical protein [Paenibacillus zeisoli]RUT28147.1 hypothetical protein EJP77_18215 [Paenibacillus zeisoli]